MKKRFSAVAVMALIGGLLALAGAPAQASALQCGQVITTSVTLTEDVGPCPGDGIVIGANDITLDLNGHTLYGVPTPQVTVSYSVTVRANGQEVFSTSEDNAGVANTANNGVGVRIGDPITGASTSFAGGFSGVTIKGPGTIKDFDAGVAVEGGGSNTVTGLTMLNNFSDGRATAIQYGDGVALNGSSNNTVSNNYIKGSGPFSGIAMFAGSSDNTLSGNTLLDNSRPTDRSPVHHGAVGFTQETDGVRVEPGSHRNQMLNNVVSGSGLDGIALFSNTRDNVVSGNTVTDNGFDTPVQQPPSQRQGDGIKLFNGNATGTVPGASTSTVTNNTVRDNAVDGIVAGNNARNNLIMDNTTSGNGQIAGQQFDLHDLNAGGQCDNNTWSGNSYETADPVCTTRANQADLAVSVADSPDPVIRKSNVTYTVTATNNGPRLGRNVSLSNSIPAGTTLVSASTSAGSCSGTSTVTCSLGDMAPGATATLTVVVKTSAKGTITNTATVALGSNWNQADPVPGNNTASASTTVVGD